MTKREEERAIKALECCAGANTSDACRCCPYEDSEGNCKNMKKTVLEIVKKYRDENEALKSYPGITESEVEQYCNGFIAGKSAERRKMRVVFEPFPPLKKPRGGPRL